MQARSRPSLPDAPDWLRTQAGRLSAPGLPVRDRVELVDRSGKSLNRFFPKVMARLAALDAPVFGLDGAGARRRRLLL
jgi:hypothetical protein